MKLNICTSFVQPAKVGVLPWELVCVFVHVWCVVVLLLVSFTMTGCVVCLFVCFLILVSDLSEMILVLILCDDWISVNPDQAY